MVLEKRSQRTYYEVSVAVQVLLWVFVFYITKKNKALFDTVQELSY